MVSRLLKFEGSVAAGETDETLDSKSPGAGKTFSVQEVYSDQSTDAEYSISYEERKLADNVPGEEWPDPDNGLPFDLEVAASEDLSILATNTGTAAQTFRFYVVVDETSI